jgi:peptidoglycan/xylan/chitin deacetylase (PgdA/CDA1 family)
MAAAGARGRGMVLLYHRVGKVQDFDEVIPTVDVATFRGQLIALRQAGDVVPLDQLLDARPAGPRPRFAITFDDDDTNYVEHVLPVLLELGVHATFFLSGRALHGLHEYWWEMLERAISAHGAGEVARILGVRPGTGREIAARCEGDPGLGERLHALVPVRAASMTSVEIRRLVDAGMCVGFHTLHHPVLPLLSEPDLVRALTEGLAELVAACGAPVRFLAYPHGRADERVAAHAHAAGYHAAFVTGGLPTGAGSPPFRTGRWEPGALTPDRLLGGLALRLHRPLSGR